MKTKAREKIGRRLCYVLRHRPDGLGLNLDAGGWAEIDDLQRSLDLAIEDLMAVVETDEKARFTVTGNRIRCAQGHSIDVDLNLCPVTPPERLYHGTAEDSVDSILRTGIERRTRRFVHLSEDPETALVVGRRHGDPRVLTISSRYMHESGFPFFRADNGVWLTELVPPSAIGSIRGAEEAENEPRFG